MSDSTTTDNKHEQRMISRKKINVVAKIARQFLIINFSTKGNLA
jgi:hypothetical protein